MRTNWELFSRIRDMPDGPVKKFQLVKAFGRDVRILTGGEDPCLKSCADLVAAIEKLLEH